MRSLALSLIATSTFACGTNNSSSSSSSATGTPGSSTTASSVGSSSGSTSASSSTGSSASSSSGASSGSSGTSSSSSTSSSSTGSSGGSGSSTGGTFDTSAVYFVGTLDTHFCGSDVIVTPDAPTDVSVGLPCFDVGFSLRNDGKLVYLYTDGNAVTHVAAFVPDAFVSSGGTWSLPSRPEANDTLIPTPACDAAGGPSGFALDPETGETIFNCPGSNDWVDEAGNLRVPGAAPLSLGYGGTALAFAPGGGLLVFAPDGGATVATGLPGSFEMDAARPVSDGWKVALDDGSGNRTLFHVDFTASATSLGIYPAFDAVELTSAIDGANALYLFGSDPADSSGGSRTIARLPLNGSSADVIYTDFNAPVDDYTSTPPHVFARVGVTGGRLVGVH
ncbi:MAG: hypothetical protein JST54_26320 [Deltaproteobacteria bacterium]|nr:hypothetical protein [Deltaproteobacteria bacterium]